MQESLAPIQQQEVFTFFWNHLEKDIETLCRATQLSVDDCMLLLHSLIHNMYGENTEPPKGIISAVYSLIYCFGIMLLDMITHIRCQ